MSDQAIGLLADQINQVRESVEAGQDNMRKEMGDHFTRLEDLFRTRTHKLNEELQVIGTKAQGALEKATAHLEHHGEGEKPPRAMVASPVAMAVWYPKAALMVIGFVVGAPTALALVLGVALGPMGGLRVLLQAANVKAIYVPTPEPTRVP